MNNEQITQIQDAIDKQDSIVSVPLKYVVPIDSNASRKSNTIDNLFESNGELSTMVSSMIHNGYNPRQSLLLGSIEPDKAMSAIDSKLKFYAEPNEKKYKISVENHSTLNGEYTITMSDIHDVMDSIYDREVESPIGYYGIIDGNRRFHAYLVYCWILKQNDQLYDEYLPAQLVTVANQLDFDTLNLKSNIQSVLGKKAIYPIAELRHVAKLMQRGVAKVHLVTLLGYSYGHSQKMSELGIASNRLKKLKQLDLPSHIESTKKLSISSYDKEELRKLNDLVKKDSSKIEDLYNYCLDPKKDKSTGNDTKMMNKTSIEAIADNSTIELFSTLAQAIVENKSDLLQPYDEHSDLINLAVKAIMEGKQLAIVEGNNIVELIQVQSETKVEPEKVEPETKVEPEKVEPETKVEPEKVEPETKPVKVVKRTAAKGSKKAKK